MRLSKDICKKCTASFCSWSDYSDGVWGRGNVWCLKNGTKKYKFLRLEQALEECPRRVYHLIAYSTYLGRNDGKERDVQDR